MECQSQEWPADNLDKDYLEKHNINLNCDPILKNWYCDLNLKKKKKICIMSRRWEDISGNKLS